MNTSAFTLVLLAMNFATYFAGDESPEDTYKGLCMVSKNKAMLDAMNDCYNEKATLLMKEFTSICAKKQDIKEDLSMKSLTTIFCAQGGDKIFFQFDKCQDELMVERKITKEMERKEEQPMIECFNQKVGLKAE